MYPNNLCQNKHAHKEINSRFLNDVRLQVNSSIS